MAEEDENIELQLTLMPELLEFQVQRHLDFEIHHLKITVLGTQGSGKTSVIRSFVRYEFSDVYQPTGRRKVYNATVIVDNNKLYVLQISDSVPLDTFPKSVLDEWDNGVACSGIRNADVYLIVFDLTSSLSYQWAQKMAGQIWKIRPEAKLALCGNKYDLYLKTDDKKVTGILTPLSLAKKSVKLSSSSLMKYHHNYQQQQQQQQQHHHHHQLQPRASQSAPQSMRVRKIAAPQTSPRSQSTKNPASSKVRAHATRPTEQARENEKHSLGGSVLRRSYRRQTWNRRTRQIPVPPPASTISHFVPCSAKFHWRIYPVFREIVDVWEREPSAAPASSPVSTSPSLFCFVDAKHVSQSESETGHRFSLSATHQTSAGGHNVHHHHAAARSKVSSGAGGGEQMTKMNYNLVGDRNDESCNCCVQ